MLPSKYPPMSSPALIHCPRAKVLHPLDQTPVVLTDAAGIPSTYSRRNPADAS
jgi:hypothetical protein